MMKGHKVHGIRALVMAFLVLFSAPLASMPQEAKQAVFVGVNIFVNGLLGGLGSRFHKKPFWRGARGGAVGGLMVGTGKYMVGQNWRYAWPAKITTSLGTSITENAVRGERLLHTFGFDMGPLYLEFRRSNRFYYLNPELMVSGALSLVVGFAEMETFSWKKTLQTGTPVFINKGVKPYRGGGNIEGLAVGNTVWLSYPGHPALSHEIIHTYQYLSIAPLGAWIMDATGKTDTFNKYHLRFEADFGSMVTWMPETLLLPNYVMPRENEADAFTGGTSKWRWKNYIWE